MSGVQRTAILGYRPTLPTKPIVVSPNTLAAARHVPQIVARLDLGRVGDIGYGGRAIDIGDLRNIDDTAALETLKALAILTVPAAAFWGAAALRHLRKVA